jgi:hypothetical protein
MCTRNELAPLFGTRLFTWGQALPMQHSTMEPCKDGRYTAYKLDFDVAFLSSNDLQRPELPPVIESVAKTILDDVGTTSQLRSCIRPTTSTKKRSSRFPQRSQFSRRRPLKNGCYLDHQGRARLARSLGVDVPDEITLKAGASMYSAIWSKIQLSSTIWDTCMRRDTYSDRNHLKAQKNRTIK